MLKMYTTSWCPDCSRAKRFLNERGIEFDEINIEEVPGAAETVISRNQGRRKVPTFDRDGHFFHCSPFDPAIMKRELQLS